MDLVWNNLLSCDYERTRPGAPRLELDLYTRSLISWPHVLLGDPRPYGRLRRPGIIDIPQADHAALTAAWHQRLAHPVYVRSLIRQTAAERKAATCRLDCLEQAIGAGDRPRASTAMPTATAAVLRVMSTHIVNWLLPEDHWKRFLAGILGDPGTARACMSALQLPDAPGHILAATTQHSDHAAAGPSSTPDGTNPAGTAATAAATTTTGSARRSRACSAGPSRAPGTGWATAAAGPRSEPVPDMPGPAAGDSRRQMRQAIVIGLARSRHLRRGPGGGADAGLAERELQGTGRG